MQHNDRYSALPMTAAEIFGVLERASRSAAYPLILRMFCDLGDKRIVDQPETWHNGQVLNRVTRWQPVNICGRSLVCMPVLRGAA